MQSNWIWGEKNWKKWSLYSFSQNILLSLLFLRLWRPPLRFLWGPRHAPNPSSLRNFYVEKITDKNYVDTLKTPFNSFQNFFCIELTVMPVSRDSCKLVDVSAGWMIPVIKIIWSQTAVILVESKQQHYAESLKILKMIVNSSWEVFLRYILSIPKVAFSVFLG